MYHHITFLSGCLDLNLDPHACTVNTVCNKSTQAELEFSSFQLLGFLVVGLIMYKGLFSSWPQAPEITPLRFKIYMQTFWQCALAVLQLAHKLISHYSIQNCAMWLVTYAQSPCICPPPFLAQFPALALSQDSFCLSDVSPSISCLSYSPISFN